MLVRARAYRVELRTVICFWQARVVSLEAQCHVFTYYTIAWVEIHRCIWELVFSTCNFMFLKAHELLRRNIQ